MTDTYQKISDALDVALLPKNKTELLVKDLVRRLAYEAIKTNEVKPFKLADLLDEAEWLQYSLPVRRQAGRVFKRFVLPFMDDLIEHALMKPTHYQKIFKDDGQVEDLVDVKSYANKEQPLGQPAVFDSLDVDDPHVEVRKSLFSRFKSLFTRSNKPYSREM